MAHELQFVNGEASFAGRSPAWHQLGYVDNDLTWDEAAKRAHLLGWNVRAEPFTAIVGDLTVDAPVREHTHVPSGDHQVVVRDEPGTGSVQVLGFVGGRYSTVQNEQAFAHIPFLESLGAKVDSAGAIREGRQVFVSMTLDEGFVIDPDGAADRVQGYLLNRTSHDGSIAVESVSTWVRVVCANTWDMVAKNAAKAFKIRHTSSAGDRLAEAQQIMLRAHGHGQALGEVAQALYKVPMSSAEFTKLVTTMYPKPGSPGGPKDSKRGLTLWEKKITLLGDLFTGGGDVEYTLGNVAGTAWAGVNAMTERIDWHRSSRGGDGSSLAIAASGFTAAVTNEKQEVFDRVVAWAAEKQPKAFAGVL
jgi:phage/plasmid-like protein (TIGR03299 family)